MSLLRLIGQLVPTKNVVAFPEVKLLAATRRCVDGSY